MVHERSVGYFREVAEMVGKQHANLLRDVEGYIQILENSKLSSQNFFIESSYVDAKEEVRPTKFVVPKSIIQRLA